MIYYLGMLFFDLLIFGLYAFGAVCIAIIFAVSIDFIRPKTQAFYKLIDLL